MLQKILTIALLLNTLLSLGKADTIFINDKTEEHLITFKEFEVFVDSSGKYDFKTIRSIENQRYFFQPYPELSKQTNTHLWTRFYIVNQSKEKNNWILQIPLHLEEVSIYIKSGDQWKQYQTGQNEKFSTRPIQIRTIALELPVQKEAIEVYVKIFSKKYTDLSFIISLEKKYLEVHTSSYLFLGFVYGILFLMAFYNAILFFSIRDHIYIYYILYTLCAIFFISWKDGLGFQFIWPEHPWMNELHYQVALLLMLISFLVFANSFLEIKKTYPKLFYVNMGVIILNILYGFIGSDFQPTFDPLPVPYLLTYFYLIVLSVYVFNNFKPARYLILSIVCMTVALVIIKLRYMELLGWNWFIEYILNYAVAIEVMIMSFAISDKLRYMKIQNEKAKEATIAEKILREEKEQIQHSFRITNDELTLATTNLMKQSEWIGRFRKEIQVILKEQPENSLLQKLLKNIEKEGLAENDWDQFRISFDKEHGSFIHKLQEKYPQLKPADLLLSAYIKLNKSNKEIASYLNISVSGVEKKRTRLKEKLGLKIEDSLTEFILKIN